MKKSFLLGLASLICLSSFGMAGDAGFKSIFNGKDLTGWDGDPRFWSVQEGAITGRTTAEQPTQGNTFIIWRQGLVDDFELRLKYRIVGGNSGIQYRSDDLGNWVVGGYQADFEAGNSYSGILYEERKSRGIMALRGEKVVWGADGKKSVVGQMESSEELQKVIRREDWNDYVIIASGNRLIHQINGKTMVEVEDLDAAKQARQGVLALQLHAGPPMMVQFKDIELKRLPLGDLKKIVLTAGTPSHGPGEHEHNAGIQLLDKCLASQPGILTTFYLNGWPKDPTAYDNADAILIYCDGGGGHPFIQSNHLELIGKQVARGAGVGCLHYAVEVPKDRGGSEFLQWIGGYFETHRSVNPHWLAEFKELPVHPVTQGVNPFEMQDEWYFYMRFYPEMAGVTPILGAVAPLTTMNRPDGPHSGNPAVRESVKNGESQTVMWVFERPDGGRGFGFTGGHFHKNWDHDDFRKVVLNAILWMAKADVPDGGVESQVTEADLQENLDPKGRR